MKYIQENPITREFIIIKHHRIGIAQSFNLHSIEWMLTSLYMPNDTRSFQKMANEIMHKTNKNIFSVFVAVCVCVFVYSKWASLLPFGYASSKFSVYMIWLFGYRSGCVNAYVYFLRRSRIWNFLKMWHQTTGYINAECQNSYVYWNRKIIVLT